ncbi:hypothetical protein ACLOJK_017273 [Asimina triloba]
MEEDGGHMESFLRWAAHQGITDCLSQPLQSTQCSPLFHSLFISYFPEAGGKGELILRVPRHALLTSESVLSKDERLAIAVKRHKHLSSTQVLGVCLLAEVGKGRASWWYPYLVQLPRTYSTLSTLTPFEIQALQVDDAIWASEKAVLKVQSDWEGALGLMKELGLKSLLLTFRSWLWASATISSRTLHIPWDDAGCLCPMGDFFNYAAPEEESLTAEDRESTGCENNDTMGQLDVDDCGKHAQRLTDGSYEEHAAAYCFYARKKYKKGEQVLLCYGTYTNLELLEHYGFLLNTNPNDKAFIQLDIDLSISNPWPRDSMYIQQDGNPSFALLSVLRLSAMDRKLRKAVGHLVYSGSVVSAENEIAILKWLVKKCTNLLEDLRTSVKEDGLLLCMIDKLQNDPIHGKVEMLFGEGQVCDFFQANGFKKGAVSDLQLSGKIRKSMERWKLAVQWRFEYKQSISNCCEPCSRDGNQVGSTQPM